MLNFCAVHVYIHFVHAVVSFVQYMGMFYLWCISVQYKWSISVQDVPLFCVFLCSTCVHIFYMSVSVQYMCT